MQKQTEREQLWKEDRLTQDASGVDGDDDDDDNHSGEDQEGIDSANNNVQYPSPRKGDSSARNTRAAQHPFRASPGRDAAPGGPGGLDGESGPSGQNTKASKQLVTAVAKTGAIKPNSSDSGDRQRQQGEGRANLVAGEQLLSSVLINMEEQAHVVIAIPQDDAVDGSHQSHGPPMHQLSQLEHPQQTDAGNTQESGVQVMPGTAGYVHRDGPQNPTDHVSVMQQGRKTVYITIAPQGGIKITSSNTQFSLRADSGNNGDQQ